MNKLAGKVAVVTGGNSGIGRATAQAFVAEGARVVITGRNAEALQSAAAELGPNVLAVQSDTSNLAAISTLMEQVKATFGGIDVLFINAGIAKFGPLEAISEALYDSVFDINVKGAFFTIQRALPLLNPGASIIMAGSVNAHIGMAGSSVYAASKAALHSLTRTLAAELAERSVRINTLNIGPVETPIYGKLGMPQEVLSGFATSMTQRLPVKRFGQPEEIAQAAVFLAAAESAFIVGAELTIDGGLSLNA